MEEELSEFIKDVKKVSCPRNHKVKNSYGVYDGFKYYRKIRPKEHKYVLNESQYFSIIRKVNELLCDEFIKGNDIIFPAKMGKLELRKYIPKMKLQGNTVINSLPVDWDRTLKLWYEDKESYRNKTLVKLEEKEVFKVYYNKTKADYNNKSFYQFNINRELKKSIKNNIKNGNLDAFIL